MEDKQLQLVMVSQGFMNSVKGLEELAESVSQLPTKNLATGYAMIKAYEKNFDGLVQAVRDEFIGTQDDNKVYNKDGRLFKEATDTDDKGNPIIQFEDGTVLKASKSTKDEFNSDMAKDVLKEYGVVEMGSDKLIKMHEGKVEDFLTFLWSLVGNDSDKQSQLAAHIKETFEVSYTPNKSKIEALITVGKLPTEAVDGMFSTKDTYSLLVSKNPYKPKKKSAKK